MTKKKRNEELQRREFMKTVATGGVLLDVGQQLTASDEKAAGKKPEQKTAAQPGSKRNASRITFPRSFTGRNLPMIAFPLGGIGTGTISLGGRGQLRDWEIFNRPDKGNLPQYGFPAIWVRAGQAKPVARVLEARLQPPYEGQDGLAARNASGLPRFESATFTGAYLWPESFSRIREFPFRSLLKHSIRWCLSIRKLPASLALSCATNSTTRAAFPRGWDWRSAFKIWLETTASRRPSAARTIWRVCLWTIRFCPRPTP
jgi:hypothetical protein